MSSVTWRSVFSYNKFTQIAARAFRESLKTEERVQAEKRGVTILRYQEWENGHGGQQVYLVPPEEKGPPAKSAAV